MDDPAAECEIRSFMMDDAVLPVATLEKLAFWTQRWRFGSDDFAFQLGDF